MNATVRIPKHYVQWIDSCMQSCEKMINDKTGLNVRLLIDSAEAANVLLIEEIIMSVCDTLHVRPIIFFSKSRKREAVTARLVALEMIRRYIGQLKHETLGDLFNRDRTTIVSSYQSIEDYKNNNDHIFLSSLNKCVFEYDKACEPQNETDEVQA